MPSWKIESPQQIPLAEPVTRVQVFLARGRVRLVGSDEPPRVAVTEVGRRGLDVDLADGVLSIRHDVDRHQAGWAGPLWWLLRGAHQYRAEVAIAVPRTVAADLTVVSGSVVAAGVSGGCRIEVTSGTVTLLGLDGTVRATTVSGSIEALGTGRADLTATTTSGEITIADAPGDRVHARTVSGQITCDVANSAARDIDLATTSGAITVRVPEDADLAVDLSCTSGRISSGFPGLHECGRPGRSVATGTLGAGAGRLRARAVSGSISLLARPVDHTFDGPAQ